MECNLVLMCLICAESASVDFGSSVHVRNKLLVLKGKNLYVETCDIICAVIFFFLSYKTRSTAFMVDLRTEVCQMHTA